MTNLKGSLLNFWPKQLAKVHDRVPERRLARVTVAPRAVLLGLHLLGSVYLGDDEALLT